MSDCAARFCWKFFELKNEDRVISGSQICWDQMKPLPHRKASVCRQAADRWPHPAGSPSWWTFWNPSPSPGQSGMPSGSLEKKTHKQGETRLFGDFHNVIKLCMCECVCEIESLLWVMAISSGGTMAKEAGCRKYCLQGAFNTSEENRISLSPSFTLSILSLPHKD